MEKAPVATEESLGLSIAQILSKNKGLKISDRGSVYYLCIRGLKSDEILETMKSRYCREFPNLKSENIEILDFSKEDFSNKIIVLDNTYDPLQLLESNDYPTLSAVVVKDKQY